MTRNLVGRSLRSGAGGLALALVAGFVFPLKAQETGSVSGQITDAGSGRPLASAQVYLEGTAFGTLTSNTGQYLFLNVPVGEYTLTAQLLGYRTVSQTVTVSEGDTERVEIGLTVTALNMDEIVVTGTGVATEKKKLGNSIATVDVGRLQDVPITSFSDVLQGREAGVVGLPGGGDTGASGRIRIRGSASLSQTNEPVIYLDGFRIDRGGGGGWGAAQASTRRIDDIDPNSIERIEILKGAAAATLYGTEASNGVIQIFTKRGRQGAARWSVQTDQTAIRAPLDRFVPHADFPRDAEQVARMNSRWGVNLQPFEVYSENYLEDFYNTGYAQTYSGSVEGGADLITYFVSARVHDENGPFSTLEGILPNNQKLKSEDTIGRRQATMNIGIFPFDNLRLRVTGLYSELNQTRMRGGNNIYGVFSLALMGQMRLADDNNFYGSRAFATMRETAEAESTEDVEHFAGSINANWNVMEGLVFDGTFGIDISNGTNVSFYPFGWNVDNFSGYNTDGIRWFGDRNNREVTGDFKLSYETDFLGDFSSTLIAGAQGFLSQNVYHGGNGDGFPGPGLEVASAGADQSTSESWTRVVNAGGYFQEQVGYQDWAFLTVGARFDANSAFGSEFATATYPKVGLSVVPTDLFEWDNEMLSSLRFRAAWGQAGLQPGAFDKFTTFVPRPAEVGAGLAPGNLGNQALKPEVTDEIEIGANLGLWNDRVALDVNYFTRVTTDALVARQFPVTGGFTRTQLDNIGQLDASGLEVTLNGSVYNSADLSINVFANTAYLDQVVTDLGGAPPLKTGGSYPRYRNFLIEGRAPGSFLGAILDPDMALPLYLPGDGVERCVEPSRAAALEYFSEPRELQHFDVIPVGCAGGSAEYLMQYIGKPDPDFAGSFGADIDFLGDFSLTTNFEYKFGNFHTQDLTGAFRQANAVIGRNVPGTARVGSVLLNPASTAEQRLDAALEWAREYRALAPMSGMNQIWTSDFIRWREISLSYRLPGDMIERWGLRNATATVGGRNVKLFMFGDYRGIDPEINPSANCTGGGVSCNFLTATEAFGVPVPRRFTFSFRVGF